MMVVAVVSTILQLYLGIAGVYLGRTAIRSEPIPATKPLTYTALAMVGAIFLYSGYLGWLAAASFWVGTFVLARELPSTRLWTPEGWRADIPSPSSSRTGATVRLR
jgi:hypothetical protein